MALDLVLVVPDTHAPFHDHKAWELMLKVGENLKPKLIVHIGDLIDFYSISFFTRDPGRKFDIAMELAAARNLRGDLDGLGAERKVFIAGNHEDRLRRYVWSRAPELAGIVPDIPQALDLTENGWDYVPYQDHIKIGKVAYTHDVGVAGKYSAQRALDTFKHSVVTGHSHRFSHVVQADGEGQPMVSEQFGWLGDASQIDYRHRILTRTEWPLGFGIGYMDSKGVTSFQGIAVINGKCVVNGVEYKV